METRNLTRYVDPFIGSGSTGHTFPGATRPFGMVKLGPDCGDRSSNSGYLEKGSIQGFSHTHVSGAGGGPAYGNILVVPYVGELNVTNLASERSDELAAPGFFSVFLTTPGVRAELTATHSVGFHRYTFPPTEVAYILFDASSCLGKGYGFGEAQRLVGSAVDILSPSAIQGCSTVEGGWSQAGPYTVYFYAETDMSAARFGTWKQTNVFEGARFRQGGNEEQVGAFLGFSAACGQVVRLKVGISFVSCEKARQNVRNELPDWDFDRTRAEADAMWNQMLNRVIIEGASGHQKTLFYTAIYHSMLMPTERTGENAKWESGEPYYDDYYAIWDTFRTTDPLLTLLAPERRRDMVRSLVDIYRFEGYMPDGRSGNRNGRTQGGSTCDIVIADAFAKGLQGIAYEEAYRAMVKNAEVSPGRDDQKHGRGGIEAYKRLGYVPADIERSGTRTVEYAACDAALALLARGLGKGADFERYWARARNWLNLWRADAAHSGFSGFIMPRQADGAWAAVEQLEAFLLEQGTWGDFLYEATPWQISFCAPYEPGLLIEKCGGPERFIARLDTYFARGYHDPGNEPGFLTPCLYSYAGRPDKTAQQVREICALFNSGRDGLPGNDDSGAMSAWYAFHAMGFYPNAGQDIYLISSPQFGEVTLHMGEGKRFVIRAQNAGEANRYVQAARLNGQPLDRAWLQHAEIKDGGLLELEMGAAASEWGRDCLPPAALQL